MTDATFPTSRTERVEAIHQAPTRSSSVLYFRMALIRKSNEEQLGVRLAFGIPVPEEVLEPAREERDALIALASATDIQAHAQQFPADISEFGRATGLSVDANRHPALRGANDSTGCIGRAGCDVDTGIVFSKQATVDLIVLEARVVESTRSTQAGAGIRRKLEGCRPGCASVARQHLKRSFGQHDVVLPDQCGRVRSLNAVEVIDVRFYGNPMSVRVARRTVVGVIGDDLKVVQQLLAHGQAVTLRLRLRSERQDRHDHYQESGQKFLHNFSPSLMDQFSSSS